MDASKSSRSSSADDRLRYLRSAQARVTTMSQSAVADLNYRYNRAGQESVRQNTGRIGF